MVAGVAVDDCDDCRQKECEEVYKVKQSGEKEEKVCFAITSELMTTH